MDKINFLNPMIHGSPLPLIAFSDDTSGLMEFLIKLRTRAAYNHVMFWVNKQFISQGNTYSAVSPLRYMKKNNRLLFIGIRNVPNEYYEAVLASIARKLDLPKAKRRYDWLGILGQAIGIPKINNNSIDYCSEDVARHVREPADRLRLAELYVIIANMPEHAHPQQLLNHMMDHEKYFYVAGYWESVYAK